MQAYPRVAVASLHPAPWNPRTIKTDRFKELCASLKADPDFLEKRPILAMADGTVYAGNMRLRAATHLGWETVPAVVEDVDERLAKERALRDNHGWGEWQEDELAALVFDVREHGADLSILGFDPAELERLLDGTGGMGDTPIPEDSREYDENMPTAHECPKCGYAWN